MTITPATAPLPESCPVVAETTNTVVHDTPWGFYARCTASGCGWVGEYRRTQGWATRDGKGHDDA